jgi:hypothetical protein
MLLKKSYATMMEYDISDTERQEAEKALQCFNMTSRFLNIATDHLDIIAVPFKDHPDIPSQQIIEFRAALRRFRDKSIENFNNFKKAAFQCIMHIQPFANDTQTAKLIKSFISAVETLEKQVNLFSALFNNLKAKDFVAQVSQATDAIKKEVEQLQDLIEDRIKSHIQTDILGKSWVSNTGNELELEIEKKTPLLLELDKQRQQQLNGLDKAR